jgi:ADP-ribose pyrophosphatase YjhB (NUDIX family)
VLLLHGLIQELPRRSAWYLPGGRLEDGESFEEATIRELAEELDLVGVELGPWIWTRHGRRPRGEEVVATTARFFLVRTTTFVPNTTRIGASEVGVDWRWWAVDEIDAETSANFIPGTLAHLVRELVEGRVPDPPVDVSEPT